MDNKMTFRLPPHLHSILVMGVSGSGKSHVGQRLAQALGIKFIDGDDLHPRSNILKMQNGIPLDDEDRKPWLDRINDVAFSLQQKQEQGVIVCSALKKAYRDRIRWHNEGVIFLFLNGDFALIQQRMFQRQGHFMKVDMLKSQFATLEIPNRDERDVIAVSVNQPIDQVVAACLAALGVKG